LWPCVAVVQEGEIDRLRRFGFTGRPSPMSSRRRRIEM
jgi:hypothetical protein